MINTEQQLQQQQKQHNNGIGLRVPIFPKYKPTVPHFTLKCISEIGDIGRSWQEAVAYTEEQTLITSLIDIWGHNTKTHSM